ncbi:MAG: NAD-dependent epimerase/dehydratase family protein [Deltaproteobacteria bacterium]|nr:NAD-dependent epimerase/dehydratase family protein [Deltaproteobacteria bacterium]
MHATVTGATGFLGGALARRLVAEGWRVVGLGRDPVEGARLVAAGVEFVRSEIDDAATVSRACASASVVYHCAALSSAWGPTAEFVRSNVVGTRVVARAAREAGARLVHVSSPSIYIDQEHHLGIREDDPFPACGINDYAETKRLSEVEVAEAAREGLRAVVLRPQGIIGPGDRAIFPRALRVARRGVFPVIGDGQTWMDLTYVENVVDALLLAGEKAGAIGRTYNVTNGAPVRLYELIERVLRSLGMACRRRRIPFGVAWTAAGALEAVHRAFLPAREPLLTQYAVCVLGRSRTLDISRAQSELGYRPAVSVDEGVERFVAWWKEQERAAS